MNLERSPSADLSEAAEIMLGGVAFLVPKLVFRQTSKIQPRAGAVLDAINRQSTIFGPFPKDENGLPKLTEEQALAVLGLCFLTEQENENALVILHHGVSLAHPHVTRDDLLDLPITHAEMIAALRAILEKAGVIRPAGGEPQGEAGATSR